MTRRLLAQHIACERHSQPLRCLQDACLSTRLPNVRKFAEAAASRLFASSAVPAPEANTTLRTDTGANLMDVDETAEAAVPAASQTSDESEEPVDPVAPAASQASAEAGQSASSTAAGTAVSGSVHLAGMTGIAVLWAMVTGLAVAT